MCVCFSLSPWPSPRGTTDNSTKTCHPVSRSSFLKKLSQSPCFFTIRPQYTSVPPLVCLETETGIKLFKGERVRPECKNLRHMHAINEPINKSLNQSSQGPTVQYVCPFGETQSLGVLSDAVHPQPSIQTTSNCIIMLTDS